MAKDKLSEFDKTLADNKVEAITMNQELDTMKATNKAMKDRIEELEEENSALEEESCSLFDKVNSNYCSNLSHYLQ